MSVGFDVAPSRTASPAREGILMVDDHPIVRQGFRQLAEMGGFLKVYEAGDVVCAYRIFHRHRPGLVVADLSLGEDALSGLSLIRRVKALEPATRILAFSMYDDPVIAARTIQAGALGFVMKDSSVEVFLEALEAVRTGRGYLPHAIATRIAMLDLAPEPSPLSRLNARELQILSLLGKGKTYTEIARILTLNYRSVVTTTALMRVKLGAGSLAELIHTALDQPGTRAG